MAFRFAIAILFAALTGCGRRAERAWFDAPVPKGPPPAEAPLLVPAACQVQWAPFDFPREVAPETWIATNVTFTNLSETVWPDNAMGDPTLLSGRYAVRLAHAWYPAAQKKRVHSDARINLDKPLAPHASATLHVNVLTPAQPGDYELVFELLQEGVLWFSDTGAEGLVIPVRVLPRAASVPPPQAAAPPR